LCQPSFKDAPPVLQRCISGGLELQAVNITLASHPPFCKPFDERHRDVATSARPIVSPSTRTMAMMLKCHGSASFPIGDDSLVLLSGGVVFSGDDVFKRHGLPLINTGNVLDF
jgi:hypothetical protein